MRDPGAAGLVAPPPGAPYPLLLRSSSYAWWRSVAGVLVAPVAWQIVASVVSGAILWLAWRLRHSAASQAQFIAAARRYEHWEGMVASHLGIALLVPISILLVRSWHLMSPGLLWSVQARPRWRFLLISLVIAVVVFGVYIGTLPLRGEPLRWQPQPGFAAFLVVVLVLTPVQAAAEEIFFRGYLLQALGSLVPTAWFGIVASALVFALFHGTQNIPLFLSRFAFGVVVGWLVLRTGGLEAAIAAHVVNNVAAFVLAGLTSSIARARTLTAVGWAQTFADVITFSVFTVLAVAVAARLRLVRQVPEADEAATIDLRRSR